ncbi:unnamed protein product, partial [Closterium sp. NIES-53]
MVLVGKVARRDDHETDVSIVLDDSTGKIEVRRWIDRDTNELATLETVRPGVYVRVHGHVRLQNNKRYVIAHAVRPITDFNEVTSISWMQFSCTCTLAKPREVEWMEQRRHPISPQSGHNSLLTTSTCRHQHRQQQEQQRGWAAAAAHLVVLEDGEWSSVTESCSSTRVHRMRVSNKVFTTSKWPRACKMCRPRRS